VSANYGFPVHYRAAGQGDLACGAGHYLGGFPGARQCCTMTRADVTCSDCWHELVTNPDLIRPVPGEDVGAYRRLCDD
jgi:hypothetical protein